MESVFIAVGRLSPRPKLEVKQCQESVRRQRILQNNSRRKHFKFSQFYFLVIHLSTCNANSYQWQTHVDEDYIRIQALSKNGISSLHPNISWKNWKSFIRFPNTEEKNKFGRQVLHEVFLSVLIQNYCQHMPNSRTISMY